jgi:transcriptional regulator with XRE-family HTH domain
MRADLTQEECAEQLTALAEQLAADGTIRPCTPISARHYRLWESNNPPWPRADQRTVLESFFQLPLTELGFNRANDLIRAPRIARGWTQQQAADAVAEALGKITKQGRSHSIDAQFISRLERGEVRWPNADYRAALRTVYGAATDAELGLHGMRSERTRPTASPAPAATRRELPAVAGEALHLSTKEVDDVHRRELLRTTLAAGTLSMTAPALAALEHIRRTMDQTLETTKVSPATLQRWDQAADEYAAVYQITPAQEMLPDILADFTQIQRLISDSQPVRARISLCHAAARLGILAAVCLSALGNHREARAWLHTARLAADESGDLTLTGQALARTSIVSLYYGTPTAALTDATEAAAMLGAQPTPAAARARIVQARALARLGHADEALRALEHAADLHAALSTAETTDTAFGYTARQFTWHYANALTHLGRTAEAADLQAKALSAYHPDERLDPALIQLDMAAGVLRDGHPEAAATSAANVWTSLPTKHRTGMVVRYTRELLAAVPDRAAQLPAVRELRQLTAAPAPGSAMA